ncbi:Hypothetical protein DHA2_17345 [Giardia duodenalis]|uniref:Coatomer subunit zeta n=1 Tax=Giardia intestinalis TaxID=5741 RepID=V6TJA0_GIAIN|nr:Hypothetical protein DHA2_17345 [Giardia intestinalis]
MQRQLAGLALTDVSGAAIYAQCYDPLLAEGYLSSFLPALHAATLDSISTSSQLHYCPYPCIYRKLGGLFLFVIGAEAENEMLLCDIASTVVEALVGILGERLSLAACKEQYAFICITLGEIVDNGFYLSDNPAGPQVSERSFKQTLSDGARFLLGALMN